jgi:hypothetical protein
VDFWNRRQEALSGGVAAPREDAVVDDPQAMMAALRARVGTAAR